MVDVLSQAEAIIAASSATKEAVIRQLESLGGMLLTSATTAMEDYLSDAMTLDQGSAWSRRWASMTRDRTDYLDGTKTFSYGAQSISFAARPWEVGEHGQDQATRLIQEESADHARGT